MHLFHGHVHLQNEGSKCQSQSNGQIVLFQDVTLVRVGISRLNRRHSSVAGLRTQTGHSDHKNESKVRPLFVLHFFTLHFGFHSLPPSPTYTMFGLVWTKEDTFKFFGLILFLSAFYVVFQQLQQAERRLQDNEKKRGKNNDSGGDVKQD